MPFQGRETMLNIAIVDDDVSDLKNVIDCLNYVKEKDGIDCCITEFTNAEHFLFKSSFDFDLVFLDIQMSSIDGLKVAKKIREKNKTIGIVFITNMRQLAIKGYEVDALDFIVKPVNKNDFYLKMKHILSRLRFNRKEEIVVGTGDMMTAIAVNSILFLEVSGHYVAYHTFNEVIQEYSTLKGVEKKLASYPFFARCNRFYLVNFNYVEEIRGDEVIVGGTKLAISRSRKTEFLNLFAKFVAGMGNKI
jgi:DNA-binding LytR/AlgR family response regulator